MKKVKINNLSLNKESIVKLTEKNLKLVQGGLAEAEFLVDITEPKSFVCVPDSMKCNTYNCC